MAPAPTLGLSTEVVVPLVSDLSLCPPRQNFAHLRSGIAVEGATAIENIEAWSETSSDTRIDISDSLSKSLRKVRMRMLSELQRPKDRSGIETRQPLFAKTKM